MSIAEEIADAWGWPAGLIDTVVSSKNHIASRFVVVDNSRSMLNEDGHKLVDTDGCIVSINCTRWKEVSDCIRVMATLANAIQAPTEFRLLNNSDPVVVGQGIDDDANLAQLLASLEVEPSGQAPICRQISEIVKEITALEEDLYAAGKIAVVVIVTDGQSSDGSLAEAMKPLEGLPVALIVRLCTTNRDIINYWQVLDAEIDLDCLILNDCAIEAARIQKFNSWLTYGEALLRVREFGVDMPILDSLDFTELSQSEIRSVAQAV